MEEPEVNLRLWAVKMLRFEKGATGVESGVEIEAGESKTEEFLSQRGVLK